MSTIALLDTNYGDERCLWNSHVGWYGHRPNRRVNFINFHPHSLFGTYFFYAGCHSWRKPKPDVQCLFLAASYGFLLTDWQWRQSLQKSWTPLHNGASKLYFIPHDSGDCFPYMYMYICEYLLMTGFFSLHHRRWTTFLSSMKGCVYSISVMCMPQLSSTLTQPVTWGIYCVSLSTFRSRKRF